MKEQTRRNILRYGIAIDLVILATGVGMLVPSTGPLLIFIYAAAVALSCWRGGWQGGLTALLLSAVALFGVFPEVATATNLATFLAAAVIESALVLWATRPRVEAAPETEVVERVTGPVAVPSLYDDTSIEEDVPAAVSAPAEEVPIADAVVVAGDFAQQPLERSTLAEVVPLESRPEPVREGGRRSGNKRRSAKQRAADEEADRQRAAEEEATRQRVAAEAEEEATRLRLAAEAEATRLAAEAEEEATRLRLAAEAEEQRLAAEAEAQRIVAEAAAERQRLENELREKQEAEERLEAARRAAEEEATRQRLEAERVAAEAEAERQRLEAERERAEAERARLENELREKREHEERVEAARRAAEEEAARLTAEAARQREEAEAERQRLEAERMRLDEELQARLAQERETAQRELQERIAAERLAAEQDLRRQLDHERQAMRTGLEQELAAERERLAKEADERIARELAERVAAQAELQLPRPVEAPIASEPAVPAAAERVTPTPSAKPAASSARSSAPKTSLLDTVTGWFRREERPRTVNLKNKRMPTNTVRRTQSAPAPRPSSSSSTSTSTAAASSHRPRLLLIERRRATADTIAPKLKHRGVDIDIVERWVDAVDEIFRFKPHAIFLDTEHPEFERMHRTVVEKSGQMPIVLTGRAGSTPPGVKRAAFVGRPYDVDEVVRLAQTAQSRPEELLAEQLMPRTQPTRPAAPAATMVPAPSLRAPAASSGLRAAPVPASTPTPTQVPAARVEVLPQVSMVSDTDYEIVCFNCRAPFNAIDADWCSCLAKERTLVCTNCLSCFCKAPPAYKEKFWVAAPPRLFERKTAEARKQGAALRPNPSPQDVKRPLVLAVEDDEEIQVIVQRVCANLEYGFIWATNGQDGLELAREYRPNLILSDAFMPRLDGREMCRMLKEDPSFTETRMVIMTGLYTDTKYRSEAVKRFHVDDYVAKPVAITDLINLLQKHLEGVLGLPIQEDLHELHRQHLDLHEQLELQDGGESSNENDAVETQDVALSDLLPETPDMVPVARVRTEGYEVCCFNCQENFDATRAEWCSCVGRDNTLVCQHCGGCFCKAPAAYRERFWIDAPPSLFERKMIGSKRNLGARSNPAPAEVKRPLILLVEDDENVQLIVRTVVSNMGYGFVVGADGQEGLTLAREYGPDMILSDAFMPKLDGREMCRLLKEDPNTARSKAVIMTGLYTDRKYRNEALDYFKVDDYVAKPLAVDDLIKLFKKHLPQEVTTAH
jgi:CheY-like chemotaxis protein